MSGTHPAIAAILLAAGASSRMGAAKPALEWNGATFLDAQIELFAAACRTPLVVLGERAAEITPRLQRPDAALFLLNPKPERGQLSSLQCGLRAVPSDVEAVFFLPVDSPGVLPGTLDALIATWRAADRKPAFAIPTHDARHGHPVLMNAGILPEILRLPREATARDVVHAHRDQTIYVNVADPRIHWDIDTPEDYQRLLSGVLP